MYCFKDEYGLMWLNELVGEREIDAIRKGLRRREMSISKRCQELFGKPNELKGARSLLKEVSYLDRPQR